MTSLVRATVPPGYVADDSRDSIYDDRAMLTLLDTNILLRSIQLASPDRCLAVAAVAVLLNAQRDLCISSQAILAFLAVATRPIQDNGLGLKHAAADAELNKLLAGIHILFDSTAIANETRRLVV